MAESASPGRPARLPHLAVVVLLAAVSGGVLLAHATADGDGQTDPQLEIRGYVVAHEDRVEWLARVPLDLTSGWNLPRRGRGYLDLDELRGPGLEPVAAEAERMVGVTRDGQRLPVADASVRFAPPHSRAFDTLADAREHVAGGNAPDEEIFWNQGYLDVRFTSAAVGAPDALAVALDLPPGARSRTALTVTYVDVAGDTLAYEVLAQDGGVELDPGRGAVLARHVAAGITAPWTSWAVVLFVVAALLPAAGDLRSTLALTGAVLAGLAVGVLAWRYTGLSEDRLVEVALPAIGGAAIVWAAGRGLLARRPERAGPGLVAFAVPVGMASAPGMEPLVQFSRGPGLVDAAGYAVGLGAVLVVVAAATSGVASLMRRELRVRRYGPLVALLLLVHVGWFELLEQGDAALLVTLLEIRALEAGQWWRLATLVVYASVAMALAWVAWEVRAYLRSRRRAPAVPADDPEPAGADQAASPDRAVDGRNEEVLDDAR